MLRTILLLVSLMAAPTAAQEPVASTRDVLSIIARVERVDSLGRTLTLRAENGHLQTVYVDRQLALFDELKSGDTVRVRIAESIVVAVRPDAKPSSSSSRPPSPSRASTCERLSGRDCLPSRT